MSIQDIAVRTRYFQPGESIRTRAGLFYLVHEGIALCTDPDDGAIRLWREGNYIVLPDDDYGLRALTGCQIEWGNLPTVYSGQHSQQMLMQSLTGLDQRWQAIAGPIRTSDRLYRLLALVQEVYPEVMPGNTPGLTHALIGQMIGATRVTVTRQLPSVLAKLRQSDAA